MQLVDDDGCMFQPFLAEQIACDAARREDLLIVLESAQHIDGEPGDSIAKAIKFVPELLAQEEYSVDQEMAQSMN